MNEQLQNEDNELIDWEYNQKESVNDLTAEELNRDRESIPEEDYKRTEMSAIRETYFNKNENNN